MSEAKARELLNAAAHALRSYEHGNGSPHLAQATADHIDAYLAAVPAPPAGPPREPKVRCIDCGERWATSTADDVCDQCRFAHEQAFKRAIDAAPAAEPVAQQPPPGMALCDEYAQGFAAGVDSCRAQQPEAPTLDSAASPTDDVANRSA